MLWFDSELHCTIQFYKLKQRYPQPSIARATLKGTVIALDLLTQESPKNPNLTRVPTTLKNLEFSRNLTTLENSGKTPGFSTLNFKKWQIFLSFSVTNCC